MHFIYKFIVSVLQIITEKEHVSLMILVKNNFFMCGNFANISRLFFKQLKNELSDCLIFIIYLMFF